MVLIGLEMKLQVNHLEANKCVSIKGECWKNPCHPNAQCFDNFDQTDGTFIDYVGRCDVSQGWIETEDLGKGKNGCSQVPKNHHHDVKIPILSAPEASHYEGVDPSIFGIKFHLEEDYHKNKKGAHIHKN